MMDKRTRKGDGTYPVKLSVAHHGRTSLISLNIYLRSDQWDKKRRIVINHPRKEFYNQFISMKLADVRAALIRLRDTGAFAGKTVTQVKDMVVSEITPQEAAHGEFASRWKVFTSRHPNARTRELYATTWKRLQEYDPKIETRSFAEISKSWLKDFDLWMMGRGNKANSRSIHLRNIRAVFKDAMDDGITVPYPFRKVIPAPEQNPGRSLAPSQLRMLFNAKTEPHRQKYVDAFKLMFLLIGINTVDLLTTAHVVGDRVEYVRAKTHRHYSIKIEPEALQIIEAYPSNKGNLISLGDGLSHYRHMAWRLNHELQQVMPGITTYWARRSWATIAASLDIPKETIAHALGHGGHTVTDIYIDFDHGKVDEANRRVIDFVLYNKKGD